jgi:tetratricopeptide (TPR) repeat protein
MHELVGLLEGFTGPLAAVPANRAARCLVLALGGRHADAVDELDALAADDFSIIPKEGSWLAALATLVAACVVLGDRDRARILCRLLLPYADQIATVSVLVGAGPVAYFLGQAALLEGDLATARTYFAAAVERATSLRSRPWCTRGQLGLATVLADMGDDDRAIALARDAMRSASEMGMASVAADVAALCDRLQVGQPTMVAGGEEMGTFIQEGETWTVALDDELTHVRDTKGMQYLAQLLASRGREFHVLDLTASIHPGLIVAELRRDAGPILDDRAKASYRQRLADLQTEIDEASVFHDSERAARAQLEIDVLTDELARALGLGGRDRRAGSPAEKARQNVSRAIKAAIDRIETSAPRLGRHLRMSVHTGTYCTYQPDPRTTTVWRTARDKVPSH